MNEVLERPETIEELKQPNDWDVICYNDDVTPMQFVINVLIEIFDFTMDKALETTISIHHSDKAKIGTYTEDIATSLVYQVEQITSQFNFPLKLEAIENEQ